MKIRRSAAEPVAGREAGLKRRDRVTRAVVPEHLIERDGVGRRPGRLARRHHTRTGVRLDLGMSRRERVVQRRPHLQTRWHGPGSSRSTGEDALQEHLHRLARPSRAVPVSTACQSLDPPPQSRVRRPLRQERLVHSEGVLLVTLSQIQLGHRLGEHRLGARQRRRVGRTIVIRQGDRRRRGGWRSSGCPLGCRSGGRGGRGGRRRGGRRFRHVVGHDERQIDPRLVFRRRWIGRRTEQAAFVLSVRQPLDHQVLGLELHLLLHLDPVRLGGAVGHGIEVQRPVKRLDVGGRALHVQLGGGWFFRSVIDHQAPERLERRGRHGGGRGGMRGRVRDKPHDGLGGLFRRLRRPAPGSRQRLRRVPIHRVGRQQPTEPLGSLVEPAAAGGDVGQDLERQHVLGIEHQHFAKHVGGSGVVLLIDQTAPEDDVRADVVGVEL